ncbi:hypothetical protein [Catenulispora acidiphila]|nr:hypothetical protein [Catenulispora acidiphila]
MDIPAKLTTLHAETQAVFKLLHAANNNAHQQDPSLRQAVALTSAAVAALEKATRCAEAAFEAERVAEREHR